MTPAEFMRKLESCKFEFFESVNTYLYVSVDYVLFFKVGQSTQHLLKDVFARAEVLKDIGAFKKSSEVHHAKLQYYRELTRRR